MSDTDFDALAASVYGDTFCPDGGWITFVDVDQWWRVRVECTHGEWTAVSHGIGDPSRAMRKAIEKAREGH